MKLCKYAAGFFAVILALAEKVGQGSWQKTAKQPVQKLEQAARM